jgi:hypothetical protein
MGVRDHRTSRRYLAYLAARMMAGDGVPDCSSARRKLARQMGGLHDRDLPDDGEIHSALRSYQTLYQSDEQQDALARLRETALEAMEFLKPFDPWLVGPVLNGTAGPYSDIQLQLFTDRSKELEMFLLGQQRVPCRFRERRVFMGGRQNQITVVDLDFPGGQVEASVFNEQDVRWHSRGNSNEGPVVRARLDKARAIFEEEEQQQDLEANSTLF